MSDVAGPTGSRVDSYAGAMTDIARAEGQLDVMADELYQLARAMEESDELRSTLADRSIPAARRLGVVGDLLGGRASETTTNLVSMVVGAGRASDLPAIADAVRHAAAESREQALAEVRTPYPLDEGQVARLAEALGRATNKSIDVQVVIDPSVKAGLLVQIDDQVFDGTVRRRLERLREAR
jgi:F-type H+-transporting ATPase subunit delta